jgi:dTDP-4-dehydrorhamnose reductase
MTALIIGSSGLVGGALLRLLQAQGVGTLGTYRQHSGPGLTHLDVTDEASVRALLFEHRPDVVFLMAALTAVDYCETHEEEARRINVGGARAVAQAAADVGAKLVFYSTEYVFDGTAGPYSEQDPICPQSVYARTKADAEQLIRDTVQDHLVLRTTVAFGWDPGSMNFAMQVYRRLSNGEEMRVPCDQVGNPTLVEYLAEASWRLVEVGARGTVNVVGLDRVPRSEFGQRLAR